MFFIAYNFKGQAHVFAGRVKIVSHSSCRTSIILKYFCPLLLLLILQRGSAVCVFVLKDIHSDAVCNFYAPKGTLGGIK